MDEIDAALGMSVEGENLMLWCACADFRNVAITANYIADRTKNAQFIVVSLRSQMFDRAESLVGIYKLQDCSHSVMIQPEQYQT